jgi:hypothetical protein
MWITLIAHAGHIGGHQGLTASLPHSGVPYLVGGLFLLATAMAVVSAYRREAAGR